MILTARCQIPPSARFRCHEHPAVHVSIVLEGGFVEKCDRAWVDAGPGTVRVSPATRHEIDFSDQGAECLVLEPGPLHVPAVERSLFLSADPWLARVIRDVSHHRTPPRPFVAGEEPAAELIAQIERRLLGRSGAPPAWLRQVRNRLDQPGERRSVERLAAEFGIHRVHLARAFREHYGTTAREYARRRRLERAWKLLAGGELPLVDVATAVGYADQSHMTRDVKSGYGVTPGDLRLQTLHSFKTLHVRTR